MALGDPYATAAKLKSRMGIATADTSLDTEIGDALATATADIHGWCGRQFNDAGTASARVYYPVSALRCAIDDFSTVTGFVLKTDPSADGTTWATTWTADQYELHPLGGIVEGITGWPYWVVRSTGRSFPTIFTRAPVQVTARWGWATVPDAVESACLILAHEIMKLSEAPFGVAGFGDFGPVRIRANPVVARLLAQYRRDPIEVG